MCYKDKTQNRKKGFTLAETLIVIGIIAVLAALIVIAVFAYLRSLTKLEYDGYAKEIFIAAQNHLSMAESQGYLGRSDFGTSEDRQIRGDEGVYYFVKDVSHANVDDGNSVLNLMLPFASIDETVRANGCYVIRYHKDSATVLDVFYWETSGRYAHTYTNEDYARYLAKTDDKSELRTYEGDSSVIGWYGGADAQGLTRGAEIPSPLLSVTNADQLKVTITDNASLSDDNIKLKLIVTGLTSCNKKEISIDRTSSVTVIVLDDITDGNHFNQLFCTGENPLIPGEDITLQLIEYNNAELTNIAYSPIVTTNSLFAYNDSADGTAHISYIRHFENLDPAVSDVNVTNASLKHVTGSGIAAKQTTDLAWSSATYPQITDPTGAELTSGLFKPVDTDSFKLLYDGQSYAINGIQASSASGSAGLFTDLTDGDTVQNLKLVDCAITGQNAGTLAGTASGAVISNVVAYNGSGNATEATVKGVLNAGGLIGTITDCDISRTAAAVVVESSAGNAGGLIGSASGGSVTASYSGGHTKNGSYKEVTYLDANDGNTEKIRYNVTGAENAGGLIGQAANTKVSCSYSTCSVKGTTAGGLIGDAAGTALSVSSCYSAGLVEGTNEGAFIGSLADGALENCLYYDIINEQYANGTDAKSGFAYMDPVGNLQTSDINQGETKISAIDANAGSYDDFVGDDNGWNTAVAYDQNLNFYYQGKYNLKTVDQLTGSTGNDLASKHYGDWPSPEVWTINDPVS